ncbi:MAG: two-component regulator propeller domain-containing protein, partial [Candidatus Latescibacterota bacterium]
MWIGTQAGLNRYDGHEFKVFLNEPFDSTTVADGWIWDIDEDDQGRLWLAISNANGVDMFDPVTESFTHFRHIESDSTSLPRGQIRSIMATSGGQLFVGTTDGLASTSLEEPGEFRRYYHIEDDSTSLTHSDVHKMFEDASGTLWFATHNGLSKMDPDQPGRFARYLMRSDLDDGVGEYVGDNHELWSFFERPREEGVLWIGGDYGLIRFDTGTGKHERYLPFPDVPPSEWWRNNTRSIAADPVSPSFLWIALRASGLARFDVRTRTFTVYGHDPTDPNGLKSDQTMSLMADRSGMVWVGTELDGIQRFNPSSVGFEHIRYIPDSDKSELPGSSVWGIYETRDGMLWINARDPGPDVLSMIDRSTGTHVRYESEGRGAQANRSKRPPGSINQMYEDEFGYLWVAGGALARLDRKTGRFQWFEPDEDDPTSIGSYGVRSVIGDHRGNLWAGTFQGLFRTDVADPGQFDHYLVEEGAPEQRFNEEVFVNYIKEDLAGFLWVATQGGLVQLDQESGSTTRYRHDPKDLESLSNDQVSFIVEREREPGVLWLATSGGLSRFDTRTEKFRHYTVRDGLANNSVYAVLDDNEGRLWMSTNAGISRFDPETETFRNYGLEIGLQSLEFDQSSAYKSPSGELFFGGVNGLNAFFPNEVSENLNPPTVALVDIKLFNTSIKESGVVELEKPLSETEEIELDYTQQDLSFDYVALHFADPRKNEFAYMLDGHDDDWIYVGDSRTAKFTNLSPGDYTFRVKAANSDGIWNEEGTSIRVVITPPFWATWWFRIIGMLAFAGVVYGGYRLRTRQLESRARALESQVNERTAALKASNLQLEQSATIVEAINQETSFSRLLTKILEEARVIPGVEKATALVYDQREDRFYVRASSGWDVEKMKDIRLSRREARDRYVRQAEEVADDIFVAKNVAEREGSELMADFGKVASFLVLRVEVEGDTAGYLVFDNLSDPDAFDQRDVELLERLREHIQSAFIKTRILEDLQSTLSNLQSTQDRLLQTEKMASLGQLTAGIAHEIRNPLNFVNNFSEVTKEVVSDVAAEVSKRRNELPPDLAEELDAAFESLKINASKIAEHGHRAEGIVHNMLEHSKVGEGVRTP